ncbi:hypothetical protein K1719_007069 [Acacia pycnantha]|nr:hypothetical protein K1719_007069 [Acacia pycnantha]
MEERATILAAISTLPPSQLSHLSLSLLSATDDHRLRLSSVLSSQSLFSSTLRHLHSLSLPEKYLLIARHLLSSLRHITTHFLLSDLTIPPPPPMSTAAIRESDLNAVLLLLCFCETHQHNPTVLEENYSDWRVSLCNIFSDKLLTAAYSPVGASPWTALAPYVDMVSRSWRLVRASCGGGKKGASPETVVGLPAVEVKESGRECVICKEEMKVGKEVCELPCEHLFHWSCILPWLSNSDTCPCCRHRLPSDDVFGEIQRLWDMLIKSSDRQSLV